MRFHRAHGSAELFALPPEHGKLANEHSKLQTSDHNETTIELQDGVIVRHFAFAICTILSSFFGSDVGHLYTLAHYVDRGLIKAPFFVQTIFGILGGIGAEVDNLVFMRRTADRLFGSDYVWSVMAAGRHQMPMNTQGALMGANVRVGLEDSLFIEHGKLASSNAQQVAKIKAILASLGLETASPAEARAMLGLKGRGAVGF